MVEPGTPDKRVRTVRLTDAGRAERELLDRPQRRARLVAAGPAERRPARAARRGDGRRRAAAHRGPGRGRRRGPHQHRGAVLHRVLLRRARHPLRRRLRSQPEHLGRRRRAHRARRPAPGRPAARRADRLRRAEVPRPRARRDQAHVGRGDARAASASGGASCGELEQRARASAASASSVWRPTGRCARPAASTAPPGYVEVEAFNDEPYAHHWFEKRL